MLSLKICKDPNIEQEKYPTCMKAKEGIVEKNAICQDVNSSNVLCDEYLFSNVISVFGYYLSNGHSTT